MSEFPDSVLPEQSVEQTDLFQDGVAFSGNNFYILGHGEQAATDRCSPCELCLATFSGYTNCATYRRNAFSLAYTATETSANIWTYVSRPSTLNKIAIEMKIGSKHSLNDFSTFP